MEKFSNFIYDNERMPVPPAEFMQRLYDFDNMLVVIPSRLVPNAYVIARRRQLGAGLTDAAIEHEIDQPDTKMCLANGVVPVCLMRKSGPSWDVDVLIQTLKARDIWAHGGADAVADMLEAQEAAEKAKIQKATRDDLWNRSGAGWKSYQARTGASSNRFGERFRLKPGVGTPDVKTVPSGSTAGSGIVLTD